MHEPMPHSRAAQLVGVLYVLTGAGLLLALTSAVTGATLMAMGVPLKIFFLVPLGLLLLISGAGLLGRQAWAWYLGLLISLSGIAVVGYRLLTGESGTLVPPLVTDVLVTILLIWEWPRRRE